MSDDTKNGFKVSKEMSTTIEISEEALIHMISKYYDIPKNADVKVYTRKPESITLIIKETIGSDEIEA
jgi:hypothetical protein